MLVAGYGTYALARLYGYSAIAAFAGAALFVCGPFSLFTSYCCTVRLHVATWIPLALLGPEIALRTRSWPGRLAGIGIGAFAYSQMLAGWLGQGTYDAALIIGAYCLYRALTITSRSVFVISRAAGRVLSRASCSLRSAEAPTSSPAAAM